MLCYTTTCLPYLPIHSLRTQNFTSLYLYLSTHLQTVHHQSADISQDGMGWDELRDDIPRPPLSFYQGWIILYQD